MSKALVSKRKPPVNLDSQDLHLFQHEFEKPFLEPELATINDVCVNFQGILFKGLKILMISFRDSKNSKYEQYIHQLKFIVKNHILNKQIKVEKGIWFTDTWTLGYFHWFADGLTRLESLPENFTGTLYLPLAYSNYQYVTESLKYYSRFDVQFIPDKHSVEFGELLIPRPTSVTTGNYNDGILRSLRNRLTQKGASDNKNRNERIYISRAKANRRRVINESDLFPILEQYGFEVVHLEDWTWHEQVELFSRCKYLVSIHGAGLTNMVLMPNGQQVLELRRAEDKHNNCYFSMASALKIDYWYLNGDRIDEGTGDDSIIVSEGHLAETLKGMLENRVNNAT
ncbi:MAG: glycosyltransferase family 61 protein [Cyclobacteriaceae bacterium]